MLILVKYAGPLWILRVFCGQCAQRQLLAVSLCFLWCGCLKKRKFSRSLSKNSTTHFTFFSSSFSVLIMKNIKRKLFEAAGSLGSTADFSKLPTGKKKGRAEIDSLSLSGSFLNYMLKCVNTTLKIFNYFNRIESLQIR